MDLKPGELVALPAGTVRLRDAIAHCNALSDAEWDCACRAGTAGPQYGRLRDIAWTALDELDGIQPVGRNQPNAFGLSDMLGNV